MGKTSGPALIALSPGDLRHSANAERLVLRAQQGVAAGLRGVMLREPALTDRAFLELAMRLRAIVAREDGGWFAIHDRAHLAAAVDADAVHVGWRSLSPRELRSWLPASVAIGLSTHAEDASEAWAGADYLFHGPVLAVEKEHAREPVGFEGLKRAVERSAVPVWALGGLAPEHASAVRAAGARGMAVLSGVLKRDDAGERARAYLGAWATANIRP